LHKRYFRWKDTSTGSDEWIEMTGREYYRFVTAPQNEGRYFVDLGDVVLECTKAKYKKYKAEDDHSSYVLEQEKNWATISISAMGQQGEFTGEEILPDVGQDVERDAIDQLFKHRLIQELHYLPEKDLWLIENLYLKESRKTIRQLSLESGIPVMTLQDRKVNILAILRTAILSEKSKKSSVQN